MSEGIGKMAKHYLAVDLGASSGRTIVGTLDNGKLTLKEMNRFWNGPTEIGGTLYWDFVHLFRSIKEGIEYPISGKPHFDS